MSRTLGNRINAPRNLHIENLSFEIKNNSDNVCVKFAGNRRQTESNFVVLASSKK